LLPTPIIGTAIVLIIGMLMPLRLVMIAIIASWPAWW